MSAWVRDHAHFPPKGCAKFRQWDDIMTDTQNHKPDGRMDHIKNTLSPRIAVTRGTARRQRRTPVLKSFPRQRIAVIRPEATGPELRRIIANHFKHCRHQTSLPRHHPTSDKAEQPRDRFDKNFDTPVAAKREPCIKAQQAGFAGRNQGPRIGYDFFFEAAPTQRPGHPSIGGYDHPRARATIGGAGCANDGRKCGRFGTETVDSAKVVHTA